MGTAERGAPGLFSAFGHVGRTHPRGGRTPPWSLLSLVPPNTTSRPATAPPVLWGAQSHAPRPCGTRQAPCPTLGSVPTPAHRTDRQPARAEPGGEARSGEAAQLPPHPPAAPPPRTGPIPPSTLGKAAGGTRAHSSPGDTGHSSPAEQPQQLILQRDRLQTPCPKPGSSSASRRAPRGAHTGSPSLPAQAAPRSALCLHHRASPCPSPLQQRGGGTGAYLRPGVLHEEDGAGRPAAAAAAWQGRLGCPWCLPAGAASGSARFQPRAAATTIFNKVQRGRDLRLLPPVRKEEFTRITNFPLKGVVASRSPTHPALKAPLFALGRRTGRSGGACPEGAQAAGRSGVLLGAPCPLQRLLPTAARRRGSPRVLQWG